MSLLPGLRRCAAAAGEGEFYTSYPLVISITSSAPSFPQLHQESTAPINLIAQTHTMASPFKSIFSSVQQQRRDIEDYPFLGIDGRQARLEMLQAEHEALSEESKEIKRAIEVLEAERDGETGVEMREGMVSCIYVKLFPLTFLEDTDFVRRTVWLRRRVCREEEAAAWWECDGVQGEGKREGQGPRGVEGQGR